MNDLELFNAMNEAEKKFIELQAEFRKRGLHNKPFVEYSRLPTPHKLDANPSTCQNCGGKDWHHTVECYTDQAEADRVGGNV